jgi:hypothetical protein
LEFRSFYFVLTGLKKFDLTHFPGLPPGLSHCRLSARDDGPLLLRHDDRPPNGTLFTELDALLTPILDKAFPVEYDNA